MTTFKPKMFKSQNGCCICRAKSSSSRFTASDRYSPSFSGCFQIEDERRGDICNACVLIVKRWNKLPASENKNWAHVVDARQGPGMKIVARPKKKDDDVECLKYKHKYIRKGPTKISNVKTNRSRSNSEGSNRSVSPSISDKTGDGGREVLQEMLSCSLSHPAWGKEGCDGQRIWWKRFRNWKHGIFPGNSARENKNTKRRPDGPSYWSTIVQFRTWNFFLCLKLKVSNLRLHLKFNPIFHYYCYQSLVLLYIWSDSSSLRAN